jgi:ATP-dependent exoDNAse (exonuclease V) beta subunit
MAATALQVFDCPLDGVRIDEASAGTGKTRTISGL